MKIRRDKQKSLFQLRYQAKNTQLRYQMFGST